MEEFADRDEFLEDFVSKSKAFRALVLKHPDLYKTTVSSLNTEFALEKKSGFVFIFRDKDTYEFLCKEDVDSLRELLRDG